MPYITSEEAYLMHHGVKGMKWGVRKDRSSGGRKKAASKESLGKKLKTSAKNYIDKPLTERVGNDVNNFAGKLMIAQGMKTASVILSVAGKQNAAEFMNSVGDGLIAYAKADVKRQIKADVALSAGKVAVKGAKAGAQAIKDKSSEKRTFKEKMVEKHGAADADVEGDPNNYSWNRKAAAKAQAKEQKAKAKEQAKQAVAQDKETKQRIADMAEAFQAMDNASKNIGTSVTKVTNSKTGVTYTKKDAADARRQLQKEVDKINDPKEKAKYQKMINSLGR